MQYRKWRYKVGRFLLKQFLLVFINFYFFLLLWKQISFQHFWWKLIKNSFIKSVFSVFKRVFPHFLGCCTLLNHSQDIYHFFCPKMIVFVSVLEQVLPFAKLTFQITLSITWSNHVEIIFIYQKFYSLCKKSKLKTRSKSNKNLL